MKMIPEECITHTYTHMLILLSVSGSVCGQSTPVQQGALSSQVNYLLLSPLIPDAPPAFRNHWAPESSSCPAGQLGHGESLKYKLVTNRSVKQHCANDESSRCLDTLDCYKQAESFYIIGAFF